MSKKHIHPSLLFLLLLTTSPGMLIWEAQGLCAKGWVFSKEQGIASQENFLFGGAQLIDKHRPVPGPQSMLRPGEEVRSQRL